MKTQTQAQTVKEIHAAFDEAADDNAKEAYAFFVYHKGKGSDRLSALLKEKAGLKEESEQVQLPPLEKAKRLRALGFIGTPEVAKLAELEEEAAKKRKAIDLRIREVDDAYAAALKRDEEEKARHALTLYYKKEYPDLKFITQGQLDDICEKYGLYCAPAENYKGCIPNEKLDEVERGVKRTWKERTSFKFVHVATSKNTEGAEIYVFNEYGKNATPYDRDTAIKTFRKHGKLVSDDMHYSIVDVDVCPPVIAAPPSQFAGLKGMNRIGSIFYKKVEIPDPIVLQPVNGGYMVLAKWGPEAEDEMLQLPSTTL